MMSGPDQVVACPQCHGLAKYPTLISGNTLGMRAWTDGRRLAPMLPEPPIYVQCGHCRECYWLADAPEVGLINGIGSVGHRGFINIAAIDVVREPGETRYYRALEAGLATSVKQAKVLRVLAWWRRNDTFRNMPEPAPNMRVLIQPRCEANMEALAHVLNERDVDEALMKAEVLRELGRFNAAQDVLGRAALPEDVPVVAQLTALCDSMDQCVREVRCAG
ncbi:MAG TPA: hypothetical protein VF284_06825 [Rhodanobacteraceae bacterium]